MRISSVSTRPPTKAETAPTVAPKAKATQPAMMPMLSEMRRP